MTSDCYWILIYLPQWRDPALGHDGNLITMASKTNKTPANPTATVARINKHPTGPTSPLPSSLRPERVHARIPETDSNRSLATAGGPMTPQWSSPHTGLPEAMSNAYSPDSWLRTPSRRRRPVQSRASFQGPPPTARPSPTRQPQPRSAWVASPWECSKQGISKGLPGPDHPKPTFRRRGI